MTMTAPDDVFDQLLTLAPNWDSYGGRPTTQAAVNAARLLLRMLGKDVPVAQAVPTASGGLQLEWHLRAVELTVCISATAWPSYSREWADGCAGSDELPTWERVLQVVRETVVP